MPIEEAYETKVMIDCLNFDVSLSMQIFKKFQLDEKSIGIIYLWDFRSHCSSILHKIS